MTRAEFERRLARLEEVRGSNALGHRRYARFANADGSDWWPNGLGPEPGEEYGGITVQFVARSKDDADILPFLA